MDEASFAEFAREIAIANPELSPATAADYAARIGDTPELVSADSDLVIVRDDSGAEIARIHLPADDNA